MNVTSAGVEKTQQKRQRNGVRSGLAVVNNYFHKKAPDEPLIGMELSGEQRAGGEGALNALYAKVKEFNPALTIIDFFTHLRFRYIQHLSAVTPGLSRGLAALPELGWATMPVSVHAAQSGAEFERLAQGMARSLGYSRRNSWKVWGDFRFHMKYRISSFKVLEEVGLGHLIPIITDEVKQGFLLSIMPFYL